MNRKNKIISSILSLVLFNCGILNAVSNAEDSDWLNGLEIAHTITDYLGDFLLVGGTVVGLAGLSSKKVDKSNSTDTKIPYIGISFLPLIVGAAEKLFISLPLNIILSVLKFLYC